jgi:hypothetical protein
MTARQSFNHHGNFPVKNCKLSEGALTRADVIGPNGGVVEDAVSYAVPIEKGDLVRLDVGSTDKGVICVEKAAAGNDLDYVHGIVVSNPEGIDATTTTAGTPVSANQRMADVALFGTGIIELETGATTAPGDGIELSESEDNIVGTQGAVITNGGMIALTYAVDGEKVAILVGATHYQPAD